MIKPYIITALGISFVIFIAISFGIICFMINEIKWGYFHLLLAWITLYVILLDYYKIKFYTRNKNESILLGIG